MPQLNPTPWFAILLLTWSVFLIIIPPKIMGHTFTNDFCVQGTENMKTNTWIWPWY
uniref:ATP synthase complex subunit 8 n=1 Tax=Strongylura marina TaxID=129068 RepID=Q7Y849_STRMH|nr:ATPase subunit 8 [Strongylura marina]AAP41245.1 ATPase subunit 8 [Strongylura marina]AAP41247.1 ATPase subunit 8 [Strongylura marina]AAP41249.1 ATPase subunit 8 [Strongylura marina]AAP41251.1 ATPase subunit 8 [Strongylura marina]